MKKFYISLVLGEYIPSHIDVEKENGRIVSINL